MKLRSVLVTATVLLTGLFVAPAVGQAAPAVPAAQGAAVVSPAVSCTAGTVCVYQDASYKGGKYSWVQGDADANFNAGVPITFSNGVKVNDNISSIINNSGRDAVFCTDKSYGGHCLAYAAGYSYAHVQYGDAYSSMKFI